MFKQKIIGLIENASKLHEDEVNRVIEVPPSLNMGDYSFPCFVLADPKKDDEMWANVEKDFFKRKNPFEIASHLKDIIEKKLPKEIERVEVKGGYLNFFVDKNKLAESIINIGNNYGKVKVSNERVMMEFSQPNTHKAFHVGHIRGTSLGESISRILENVGNKVIRANYSGDTGMHIAKWIWCYLNFHKKEKLSDDESWIAGIYVDAVKRLSDDEGYQDQVNEINRKIESKSDKEINSLWKKSKDLSVKSWNKIYEELGTRFDRHYFESELEEGGKRIAKELEKKGIAEISDEALIVNLEKHGLGIWVLLRSDGTVLYSAKDLALAREKIDNQKLDRFVIITGDEQNAYFNQLLKTLDLMDMPKRDKYHHIGFGMIRLPHGKMSSRTGDNILYSEFKEELREVAEKSIRGKWPKLSNKEVEKRSLKIAISSIKYAFLKQDTNKLIVFDKDQAMRFEGNTGPYLQYSYARANSILEKSKSKKKVMISELSDLEIGLMNKIGRFPEVVVKGAETYSPSIVANYAYELSKVFNEFYHSSKVIGSKEEAFRLKLVDAFRKTLKNALYLLGIEVMEEM